MDGARVDSTVLPLKLYPGMPPRHPLRMPVQDLRRSPERLPFTASLAVRLARLLVFGGAALLAVLGAYEMTQVVSIGGITLLEAAMTAVFTATFAWISLAATSALAGAILPPAGPRLSDSERRKLATRTALVMPIYHEDSVRTTASLEVMARALHAAGESDAFEIVILSDSTNADSWLGETLAVDRLSRALAGLMPVWYRRRWANTGKKAGNIKDFVENWGGRYDHFIVLDADSLMAPGIIISLAAAMESDSRLGLLQTVPVLAGGATLFARLQQFAGRVHGPVAALGLAAWQGSDGNYWGHNAIIRTKAFAACCGLPVLAGSEPFGGPILSHDFVEAALLRRAGWRVEMAARLGGSWEESPPSLIDAAARDRRWAQGNLQHSRVIGARGLSWVSRAHLAIGIGSYLASPFWLLLIGFGFALSVQASVIRPEYFTDTFQLFPSWPHFDSERMIRLFALTTAVLLLPKLLGFARAMATPELRRGCGGAWRLAASSATELLLSALLAPIMMAIHSRQIYEILAGRNAGWSAQRRQGGETTWREAWRRHRWHMTSGLLLSLAAWFVSPAILVWLSPTLAGLALAVPMSRASGSSRIGLILRRAGLLVTPEETAPHPLFAEREASAAAPSAPQDGIAALIRDEALRDIHFRWASPAPRQRGAPDSDHLVAVEKIRDARTAGEALAWLGGAERVHLAGHRWMAEELARLPQGVAPERDASVAAHGSHAEREEPQRPAA